jgi:Family of unknown function (DUF5686)/CarboxypepD_reg-like domain
LQLYLAPARYIMVKYIFTALFILMTTFAFAQDYHTVRGYVYDENSAPLPSVEIRVKNTGLGTVTNDLGQYEIRLVDGMNRLVFTYVGYNSETIDLVSEKDVVKNLWLNPDDNTFNTVEIVRKKRDISYMVVKRVIDRKDSLKNLFQTQKCEVYIKSVEEIESTKKNKKDDIPREAGLENLKELENIENIPDSVKQPNMHLYETKIIRHFKKPGFIKEERTAVKKFGSQQFLFYRSTTEGFFNLYENLIYIRTLGQNALVSPFSNTAFVSYKFKIRDIYFDDQNRKIYKIRVIPRKLGNALFNGEIEVYDSIWQLKSVDLEVPKTALIQYDRFRFHIDYTSPEKLHDVEKQSFTWKVKNGNEKITGSSFAIYSNHVYDTSYHKRYFNAELRVTEQSAYEKDTSFWTKIRPEPLTLVEQSFVRYRDSLHMIQTSTQYLDSIDSLYNKITPLKLLWSGQGYINRSRKENFEFSPLISVLDPIAIGGWRIRYFLSYYRKFENRKSISISPFLNYGFKNNDFKGSLNLSYLHDPLHLTYFHAFIGRYFDFVNPFASISTIIRRDNFFEKNFLSTSFSTELVNGLYLRAGLDLEERNSLVDFSFASLGDSLYSDNLPIDFDEHRAVITRISLSYTPRQLYLKEPFEKIVLGSKYPTLRIGLTKAWDEVLSSSIKFSYGEINLTQKFNLGIFGVSEYRFTMGKFFDTSSLRIMDYRYQRAGDPYFFTPAMYTYQLLDSTFPTFKLFYEGHFVHQFNGFIMNRIPVLKNANLKAMAGVGFLYAPERNYEYTELFFGLNRVIKLGKERLRLGLYYTVAQSNQFDLKSMFKVSFEFYNRTKNTWSF